MKGVTHVRHRWAVLKDRALEPQLGALLSEMLVTMTDRGPDSAGIAIYGGASDGAAKITIQSPTPEADFAGLSDKLATAGFPGIAIAVKSTHAVLTVPADKTGEVRAALEAISPPSA